MGNIYRFNPNRVITILYPALSTTNFKTNSTNKLWPCFSLCNGHRDYIIFIVVNNGPLSNGLLMAYRSLIIFTPHAQRERGKVIGRGVRNIISESAVALYVGLSRIVRNLIQKSTV